MRPVFAPPPRFWADVDTRYLAAWRARGLGDLRGDLQSELRADPARELAAESVGEPAVESAAKVTGGEPIAILPVAATEQHGPHLPLGVDTFLLDGIISASLAHLPDALQALFLPTQTTGFSPEHAAFGGTLSLRAPTLIALWTELAESVAKSGVKKIVLLNSHGGQAGLLDIVARDLRARLGLLVVSTSWFQLPLGDAVQGLFSAHEHRFGVHAGEIETSMMLALAPHRVNMRLAQDFASTSTQRAAQFPILGNGRSAKFAWATQDLNVTGAVGNASAATADKGRAVIAAAGQALAQLLMEVDALPLSTLVPQSDT